MPDSDVVVRPLEKLQALIGKYVVMSDAQRLIVALWIVHSWIVQHCDQTPYLTVTSPQRQCGKSRLLELLELLCPRPMMTVMPSEAVIYRTVNATMPTLLLDEVDAIFAPKTADRYEGLRAILNAGHRKGATVSRCINFGNDLERFEVYCAKVLAGIGVLPATITDRSIPIRLRRKTRGEKVSRFFLRTVRKEVEPITEGIRAWTTAQAAAQPAGVTIGQALAVYRPDDMPEALSDRMIEGTEILVAIADALRYGVECRAALVELLVGERQDERESAELNLLRDVRDIFDGSGAAAMSTEALVLALCSNGNGWTDWYGGLQGRHLAALVKPYDIHSTTVRVEGEVKRGYRREHFADAWARYLPDEVTNAAALNGHDSAPGNAVTQVTPLYEKALET